MFSLPGTPVVWKGDEIGMGDDLSLNERDSVRTPMQWSDEENGGFSDAPRERLIRPVIQGGDFGYERLNAAFQRRDPDSFLNWVSHVIHKRKECPEFGWGECKLIETGERSVFAHQCEWEGGLVIAVHNLADRDVRVTLDLGEYEEVHLFDVLADRKYERVDENSHTVELEPYGYLWLRVDRVWGTMERKK
jgi:maltose alpha-D-glucosyltransferase / alpha-amylase